jgi:glutathione peroxidase
MAVNHCFGIYQGCVLGALMACAPSSVQIDAGPLPAAPGADASVPIPSDGIWGIELETIEGNQTTLGAYAGKAIVVVNTASRCGYTYQYEGLQNLHERYADRGVVVLGFPCNQFREQDPGTNEEIADFCELNYGVTFQMMAKIDVKGDDQHALYRALTQESDEALRGDVSWNFEKFLIRPDGVVSARFRSSVDPENDELISALEGILP